MHKSKIDFYHKEIGDCTYLKDFKKILSLINSLTGRNNKSTSSTEISVNDNSITDSKLIAESFKMNILLTLAIAYRLKQVKSLLLNILRIALATIILILQQIR
jgi:hypothetical protein